MNGWLALFVGGVKVWPAQENSFEKSAILFVDFKKFEKYINRVKLGIV